MCVFAVKNINSCCCFVIIFFWLCCMVFCFLRLFLNKQNTHAVCRVRSMRAPNQIHQENWVRWRLYANDLLLQIKLRKLLYLSLSHRSDEKDLLSELPQSNVKLSAQQTVPTKLISFILKYFCKQLFTTRRHCAIPLYLYNRDKVNVMQRHTHTKRSEREKKRQILSCFVVVVAWQSKA